MIRVLVLGVDNSCRSIMTEALINHLGKGLYEAVSAGSHPTGVVHHRSLETLKWHGIDPGQPRSKSWREFNGQSFHVVITVCDDAAGESCFSVYSRSWQLHWNTPDPAKARGPEAEVNAVFERVFLSLEERVCQLLS